MESAAGTRLPNGKSRIRSRHQVVLVMRVGIDARYGFRSQRRGIGQYVASLLAHLPAAAGERDEFVLYVDRGAEKEALPLPDPRFHLRRLGTRNPLVWEEFTLPRAAARDRLDLLHLTSNYGPTYPPCPTVYTVHDLIEFIRPTLGAARLPFRHRAGRGVRTRTLPGQLRRASRVITVSGSSRADLVRVLGLREDVIRVIYHGVPPEFVPASDPGIARRRLVEAGFPVPDRYVLALGALDPRKNGPFLIRAFARMLPQMPDIHLWIVGVERPETYALPLAPAPAWLTVLGFVGSGALVSLFQGASAFVYPSLYEGFGLPVLQAMACGVPVLASSRSSIPEVCGGAAALFDPCDEEDLAQKLALVLFDEEVRRERVRAGLAQAQRFSWPDAAVKTYAVYQEAVAESRLRPARAVS